MPKMIFIVHVAGPMIEGLQVCSRCGCALTDYREAMTTGRYPLKGWNTGAFVARNGSGSVVVDHDAAEDDEVACSGEVG